MLKKLLLGAVALPALLAIVIAMRPSEFTIRRSMRVNAPPGAAFHYANDPRQLQKWNPWAQLDPNMKSEFSGAPSGVGAVYTWEGNSQVGQGRQTIVESVPGEKVAMKLEFFEPMEATNDVLFLFDQSDGATQVTWSMSGRQNFIMKGMSLIMDMDQMIGDEFTKGLTALKTLAEADTRRADRGS
jgi:uncharacterized protein YndB with AHSA1/START domain